MEEKKIIKRIKVLWRGCWITGFAAVAAIIVNRRIAGLVLMTMLFFFFIWLRESEYTYADMKKIELQRSIHSRFVLCEAFNSLFYKYDELKTNSVK